MLTAYCLLRINDGNTFICVWLFISIVSKVTWVVIINGRDVRRKNVINNVDKSSVRAPWQNDPYRCAPFGEMRNVEDVVNYTIPPILTTIDSVFLSYNYMYY